MTSAYSISVYLDLRRAKASGKFPVKLRVYDSVTQKQKMYSTQFEFIEKEFKSIWKTTKPRSEYRQIRLKLQAMENRANEVASKLNPFSFDQFEKRLYRKKGDGVNLKYNYEQKIHALRSHDRIGTASNYELSQKSLIKFSSTIKNQDYGQLTFYDITPDWLSDYEYFMVNTTNKSLTTVSMYLRALRTLFNDAIAENEIERTHYPFGKRKYQVPASRGVKKALSTDQLKILYNSTPDTQEQQRAKDFWFFSYACNGINTKDIAQLRNRDIDGDKIYFYRAKTLKTSKANLKPIVVYLNDFSLNVIEKYKKQSSNSNDFVFSIISEGDTPEQQHKKIKNFNRFLGQHLKKLCVANDLPKEISPYWARHSFATTSIRKGASMELLQESLGHGNIKTTQNYFAGFDNSTKKDFANQIMDFD